MSAWEKQFPPEEGWIKATLSLRSKVTLEKAQAIINAFFGSPEIGRSELKGTTLTVIYRERRELQVVPLCGVRNQTAEEKA